MLLRVDVLFGYTLRWFHNSYTRLGGQYLYMAPFTLVNLPARPIEEIYRDKRARILFCSVSLH